MGIQFIQMVQKDSHHLLLKGRHHPVEVIDDLFLCGFQIVRNDLLLIKNIIFGGINLFAGQQMFQDVPRALAIDIPDGPGYLDIGSFQHLLEPVEFPGPLSNQTFAVTYKFPQFPLVFVRNVACSQQAML